MISDIRYLIISVASKIIFPANVILSVIIPAFSALLFYIDDPEFFEELAFFIYFPPVIMALCWYIYFMANTSKKEMEKQRADDSKTE